MFGSWNYGGVRFPNGTAFDVTGGFKGTKGRSFELAEAWMISAHPTTNLLTNPSNVCDASSSCGGPGDAFSCTSTRRNLRSLQQNPTCANTDCSFIQNDIIRQACEEDLLLSSGDTDWTCQPSYVNPVIDEADPCDFLQGDCKPSSAPTAAPTSSPTCNDSSLRLKIRGSNGKYISRSCTWVSNKDTINRCGLEGVSEACPSTCGTCNICADPPSSLKFKFNYNGRLVTRKCDFVGRIPSKVFGRCSQSNDICRATCNAC